MFPPKDLTKYLQENNILSKSRNEIKQIISQDYSLDEETKKRWLKYYKMESGAELFLGILTGNIVDDN